MQERLEKPKTLLPTDDVWMTQAAPDWATGGAGFTQQDVGVCALLHQPLCTQTQEYARPKPAESQKQCARGAWLSACFMLEMVHFPEERDKTIIKRRGICQPHILCAMCLQQQDRKDRSHSWLKADIHS